MSKGSTSSATEENAVTAANASFSGKHLPVLDGLRGLAILMVLAMHFAPNMDWRNGFAGVILHVLYSGWIGVDLFFVLSGFLITGILYDAKETSHYFRNFYARRVLRIFPIYYGVLIGYLFVLPALIHLFRLQHSPSPAIVDYLGQYQDTYRQQAWLWFYGINIKDCIEGAFYFPNTLSPMWSLAIEEHFYLAWPLVVYLCSRRQLLTVCYVCMGGALALRIGLFAVGANPMVCYVLTFCRMDCLALGGLLAILVRDGANISDLARRARPILLATGVLLLEFAILRGYLFFEDPYLYTVGYSVIAVFFGAFLITVVAAPASLPTLLLNNAVMRCLGKYSYAMYVLHRWLIFPLEKYASYVELERMTGSAVLGMLIHIVCGIVATLGVAVLSWNLFEKHFLKLKRFFEYRPRSAVAPGN